MRQEAEAARQASPDDPTPDLLLAEGYAGLGLFEQAREACAAARRLHPDDTGLKSLWERLSPSEAKE